MHWWNSSEWYHCLLHQSLSDGLKHMSDAYSLVSPYDQKASYRWWMKSDGAWKGNCVNCKADVQPFLFSSARRSCYKLSRPRRPARETCKNEDSWEETWWIMYDVFKQIDASANSDADSTKQGSFRVIHPSMTANLGPFQLWRWVCVRTLISGVRLSRPPFVHVNEKWSEKWLSAQ